MELYRKVRLACRDGMSERAAARHFGASRQSVRKMLQFSVPPGYRRTAPVRRPKLEEFTGLIEQWLIARSLKVSPATVGKYIRRAEMQGLSWPLPEPLDDAALERRLFPAPVLSATQRPLPEWSEVHRELRQKDVTLALLGKHQNPWGQTGRPSSV